MENRRLSTSAKASESSYFLHEKVSPSRVFRVDSPALHIIPLLRRLAHGECLSGQNAARGNRREERALIHRTEQRRRRAELRAKIKACEDEMEVCGAREVELDNEINSPEVYNDPDLLRQKSDELSDLRFHQEELFAAWEAAMEEQECYEQSQTEE